MNRDNLYKSINKNGINHKETIAASEELDKQVLQEILKDPKVENVYLKQIIKGQEYQIRNLQRRILELSEIAQMKYESGLSAIESIGLVVKIAEEEKNKVSTMRLNINTV